MVPLVAKDFCSPDAKVLKGFGGAGVSELIEVTVRPG
jgi:hypothetical protein